MEAYKSVKKIVETSSVAHKRRMGKNFSNVANRIGNDVIWSKDLEPHAFGEYSFAAVQANTRMEDYSQVDVGRRATFVGVYDGHSGDAAANHVRDTLLGHFVRRIQAQRSVSERILKGAISDTEDAWIDLARDARAQRPDVTRVGSCCLVGLIWNGMLYVGNLGDSRAVIGRLTGNGNKVIADQITEDHNANLDEVREELKKQNKDDPEIVVKVNGVWRVKGLIQISRSIGDLHLKMQEFVNANQPMHMIRPALSDEPFLTTRILGRDTRFVVFASDGLWENMTSQEAVDIVNKHPRAGIAKTLVAVAMREAAIQKGLKYDNLPNRYQQPGDRRLIHDDITVAVLFLDNGRPRADLEQEVSVKAMANESTPSELRMLGGEIRSG
uniref:probable protein phosphatase 2C 43 n=1 Tax=Erigeron canadensis TaxID=72917 RepID=UPI001CB9D013|nr:probable protein phosphatase 2C 43 [Erigeron canadensis]